MNQKKCEGCLNYAGTGTNSCSHQPHNHDITKFLYCPKTCWYELEIMDGGSMVIFKTKFQTEDDTRSKDFIEKALKYIKFLDEDFYNVNIRKIEDNELVDDLRDLIRESL